MIVAEADKAREAGRQVDWRSIGQQINRKPQDCNNKFKLVRDASLKKGPFTKEEVRIWQSVVLSEVVMSETLLQCVFIVVALSFSSLLYFNVSVARADCWLSSNEWIVCGWQDDTIRSMFRELGNTCGKWGIIGKALGRASVNTSHRWGDVLSKKSIL